MIKKIILTILISILCGALAIMPSYVPVCIRDQKTLNECFKNVVKTLKPILKMNGIPELEAPPIEPYKIDLMTIYDEHAGIDLNATNLVVKGGGDFELQSISGDIDTLTLNVSLYIPKLDIVTDYSLHTNLFIIPIRGDGELKVLVYSIPSNVTIKFVYVERNGTTYVAVDNIETIVDIEDYSFNVSGLSTLYLPIDNIVNRIANSESQRRYLFRVFKPFVEKNISELTKIIGNRITSKATFDEFLPIGKT